MCIEFERASKCGNDKVLSLKIELPFGAPNKENAGLAKIVKCQAEKWISDNQKTYKEQGIRVSIGPARRERGLVLLFFGMNKNLVAIRSIISISIVYLFSPLT